jgi:PKD repeat protein
MNKNKKYAFMMGLVMCISLLALDIGYSPATVTMNEPSWELNINIGDTMYYQVNTSKDSTFKSEYTGFKVTSSAYVNMGGVWADQINLTRREYNAQTQTIVDSSRIFGVYWNTQWNGGGGLDGFVSLSDFQDFIATPVVPVKSAGQSLDLNLMGGFMTNLTMNESAWQLSTYGAGMNLTQFNVVGNELQVYNSTTGHYCNMTYFNNGTLDSAKINMYLNTEGSWKTVHLNITRVYDENLLDPIDGTTFQYPAWNSLVYDVHTEGMSQGQPFTQDSAISLNITSDQIVPGSRYNMASPVKEVNASQYNWNPVWFTWDRDNPGQPASGIAVGNDYQKNIWSDNKEIHSNMLYQPSTTGLDLNATYGWLFIDYLKYFDGWNAGGNWLRFTNTSDNAFLYIELFANGTTSNYTSDDPDADGQRLRTYLYRGSPNMPKENKTDSLEYGAKVGDDLIYHFTNGTSYDYGKYSITSLKYGAANTQGMQVPAIIVNASFNYWTTGTPGTWTPQNDPINNKMNAEIGVQNEDALIMTEGPWHLVMAKGTTGQFYNDSHGKIYDAHIHFDTYEIGASYWNGKRVLTDEWCNMTWNADGIVTYMSFNFTDPNDSKNKNLTMTLTTSGALPGNLLPGANFTYVINNGTVNCTDTTTNIDAPLWYEWDFGDGTILSGTGLTFVTHTYTANNTYTVGLKVKDSNGDGDTTSENVLCVITILPPNDTSTTTNTTTSTTTTTNSSTTTNSTSSSSSTSTGGSSESPIGDVAGFPIYFLLLASVSALFIFRKKFRR